MLILKEKCVMKRSILACLAGLLTWIVVVTVIIFGALVDGRLCAIVTFLQQTSPKRRHVGIIWNM